MTAIVDYNRIAASFNPDHPELVSDELINRAVTDANNCLDQIILELAAQYPELDRAGIFAAMIAQGALYLTAAANGPEWARRVAEEGVIAFEYNQPENHAA